MARKAFSKEKRSLYDCLHAQVVGEFILCARGHPLSLWNKSIDLIRLKRGDPLRVAACQKCRNYEGFGDEPIPPSERGWLDHD